MTSIDFFFKPYNSFVSFLLDLSHDLYLGKILSVVVLVDAYGIYLPTGIGREFWKCGYMLHEQVQAIQNSNFMAIEVYQVRISFGATGIG